MRTPSCERERALDHAVHVEPPIREVDARQTEVEHGPVGHRRCPGGSFGMRDDRWTLPRLTGKEPCPFDCLLAKFSLRSGSGERLSSAMSEILTRSDGSAHCGRAVVRHFGVDAGTVAHLSFWSDCRHVGHASAGTARVGSGIGDRDVGRATDTSLAPRSRRGRRIIGQVRRNRLMPWRKLALRVPDASELCVRKRVA